MEEIKSNVNINVNKKKRFYFIILIIAIIIIIIFLKYNKIPEPVYQLKGDKLYYPQDRGKVDYNLILREDNSSLNYLIYNISFDSRDFLTYKTRIYGILFIPREIDHFPGVVYLPGGSVNKERVMRQVSLIAMQGFAVLVIDQRGIGETGGYYLNLEDDYNIFINGKEPVQHLSVYDVLRSYDVLTNLKNIDHESIIVVGESMGGRYAIIAAGIEKRIKGVLAIGSTGFHVKEDNLNETRFLRSIDPDIYIGDISPNPVIMMHGRNDSMVPLDDARLTFSLAKEPKQFYIYDKCGHGYCPDMDVDLIKSLKSFVS